MNEPVARAARAAARRLAGEYGPGLEGEVEAALVPDGAFRQYGDLMAVASRIVSVAGLAWTVYQDLRSRTSRPSREVIARRIRLQLPPTDTDQATRDRVIEIVLDETVTDEDG